MTTTTVVNLKGHRDDPSFAGVVYVGRAARRGGWQLAASPLANPFRPGPDGTRAEVVAKYREYLLGRPDLLALLPALRGRRLGCWCAPQPCHATVIAELADTAPTVSAVGSALPGGCCRIDRASRIARSIAPQVQCIPGLRRTRR